MPFRGLLLLSEYQVSRLNSSRTGRFSLYAIRVTPIFFNILYYTNKNVFANFCINLYKRFSETYCPLNPLQLPHILAPSSLVGERFRNPYIMPCALPIKKERKKKKKTFGIPGQIFHE
ncbi:hypothetical protein PUN28_004459 [Cardiocondyla obscurior]|uniref:Uncharacterized protein n=1 Tax=Cardiocondyla obscurior TaxID=286306 RepID=A0AAW2GFY0_9HYME